jgi:acetoin utilization protein AcuB
MPLSTPIVQILERDPVTVDVGQKFSDAAAALSSERFHHLPVLENGRLVGMLSAFDIVKVTSAVMGAKDAATMEYLDRHYRLADLMHQDVIVVGQRATVGEAARLLSAGGFHALPVVDANEHVVGIVTTTDLLAHMLEATPESELPPAVARRMHMLERVFDAAQSYLLSGMALTEHEQLEKVIEAVRRAA